MDENFELIEHIYKDSSMASFSLTKLLSDLKEKDNKIKTTIESILKEYEEYISTTKEKLKSNGLPLEEEGFFTKAMSTMGISKEVKSDNSDSAIADLLIKGVSMGSIDMEKKIKDYENVVDSEQLKLANSFLKFQQKTIEDLKKYL